MKSILSELITNKSITKVEAENALLKIGRGEVNNAQIAAFLMAIQQKGISVDELEGFRNAMLELAIPLDLSSFNAMDIVGTGGDGKDTFNISTTSAFIIAGAGQAVAKHGNHGVSSAVGSSTVLEYLGVEFSNNQEFLQKKLESANICYLHAPLFHPAMKYVAPIRKELGIKTFFNILGPLLNPAKLKKQLLGVYDEIVFELYAKLLERTTPQFGIVYDKAGYDEISLTGNNILLQRNNLPLFDGIISDKSYEPETLHGGNSTDESAKILLNILQNQATEAQKQVVLMNAGVALSIAKDITIEEGILQANESIDSGKAYLCFKKLIEKS